MCNRIPTEWQLTKENWKCPKCGSKEPFRIVNNFETEEDCSLLHEEDICSCVNCHSFWEGKYLSIEVLEAKNWDICPACKGKGRVEKIVEEEF